jgi:hypothetical protein
MGENKAVLKVTLREAFKKWLEFTRSFNRLTDKEIELMALLLYHRHMISKEVNSEIYINKILFGTELKKQLRDELGCKTQILINLLANLREKGVITKESIKSVFIPKIEKDFEGSTFRIVFELKISESYGKG